MKKMRFVTKGLTLLLMGVMLAGCSDQASESSSSDEKKQSVEQSSEESKESSVDESKETEVASSSESAVQESTPASTESTPASTESSSQAPVESSEPQPTETAGQVTGDKDELVKKYTEYFRNVSLEGKLLSLEMDMSSAGMPMTLAMSFGAKDGASFLYIGLPTANSSDENGFSLYFMADKSAYLKMALAGQDTEYYKTKNLSDENASSLNFAEGLVDIGDGERDVRLSYDHEEVISGVTYDVLTILEEESSGFVYMNRNTGDWEMMKISEDGQEALVTIREMNALDIPGEFGSAEELSEEDFTNAMIGGMMMLLLGGGGLNLD